MHVFSRVIAVVHDTERFCYLVILVVPGEDDDTGVLAQSLDDLLGLNLDIRVELIVRRVLGSLARSKANTYQAAA